MEGDSAECYNSIGDILIKKGKFEEALENYYRAYKLKPDVDDYAFDYGVTLAYLGRYDEAREILLDLLREKPSYVAIYPILGRVDVETGNYDNSIDLLRRAILNDNSDIVSRFYLAVALKKLGRDKRADEEFQRVIEQFKSSLVVAPNNPEGYYFIGIAYKYLGDYEDAALNLKRAIELDTPEIDYHRYSDGLTYHDFDVFMAYAEVLHRLKRDEEALESIDRALELFPDNKEALELRKRLV